MATIGKNDIVREIATAHGQTQDNVRATIDALIDAITAHTAAGDKVKLLGFGSFALEHRAARTARNPQTGQPVEVPAKDVLKFKPASQRKA